MRIAIIGGGAVGLCSAVALARAGHGVTVFDPATARAAPSWNNAGHVATEQVAPLASLAMLRSAPKRRFAAGGALDLPRKHWPTWLPFGLRLTAAARPARFRAGQDALRALLAEAGPAWARLERDLGHPDLFREAGHLVVWESAATAADGRRAWESADIGTASITDPSAADRALLNRIVASARVGGAIRFHGTGQVRDLSALASALEQTLAGLDGQIVRRAVKPTLQDGRAVVPGHDADLVLVAAGVASGGLMRGLGHRTVPIVAERGYHIRAAADAWPADACPVVFEDRSMIVTRYAGAVQAASFVEIARPDAPPDPSKWERLEHHVAALGLPMQAPFTRWMGARPTLPDYLPAIGRSAQASNLVYAFGHQHLGLTLAPLTGELVAGLIDGGAPAIDLARFDIDRFSRFGR